MNDLLQPARWRVFRLVLVAGAAVVLVTGCPKRPPPPESTGPVYTPEQQNRLEQARAYARKRFDEEYAKAVKFDREAKLKEILLEKYRIDLDALFPEGYSPEKLKTADQVMEIVRERAEADTNKKYSPSMLLETHGLSKIEHPLFVLGDTVKVRTARGSTLNGKITMLTDTAMAIDGTQIILADVVEPEVGCFIPERNEKLRELYVRTHFKIARDDYKKLRVKELQPGTFREYAFIAEGGRWVRLDDFIASHVKAELDKLESDYDEQLKQRLRVTIELEMQQKGMLVLDSSGNAKPE